MKRRECAWCRALYEPAKYYQRYCQAACRFSANNARRALLVRIGRRLRG